MAYSISVHSLANIASGLIAATMLMACSKVYTSPPIQGRVVDAVTKQPVAGANVLVTWSVYVDTHRHFEGYMEVKEAVTDTNGEFYIEGWGPTKNPFRGLLTENEPRIIIFKPWFHVERKWNPMANPEAPSYAIATEQLNSNWNNRTIEIQPVVDQKKYLEESLGAFSDVLYDLRYGEACDWTKAPKFISATQGLFIELSKLDVGFKPNIDSISLIHVNDVCPTKESIFGKYNQ